ncbi:tripartite motif-containing protein 3-like isoform X2 [Pectinophora gossypiella]|uniref:tripartite motif-containing protein 3-like isoform X2 n=1 Tax=Pectinophora gossypiella TaxID=13191 RepID=UPI00214DFF6A|nr:tripartite motif-containing protein 3-like isoform X2 [Pectinophora gossypiella]
MAEKLKKKPGLSFVLKRWSGEKRADEPKSPKTPATAPVQPTQTHFRPNAASSRGAQADLKTKRLSAGGIKELVQCSLCLEVMYNPKMLPCQHTFCMACLLVYITDKPIIECPTCRVKIQVKGANFVKDLPSNLYIDSLLEMFGVNGENKSVPASPGTPTTPTQHVELHAGGVRCSYCKTMCDSSDISACQHCKMDRCERIVEQINLAADEKINAIIDTKNSLLREASNLQKNGDLSALALRNTLDDTKAVASKSMANKDDSKDKVQVTTFINLHQNALQILSDVSKWDVERFVFDKENFRIEQDSLTPVDAESDDPLPECGRQNEPLESEDSLVLHYRSRNFLPHYVWRKTSRPGGVGIGPWDNHLYVCGMDSHCVLVVERSQARIVSRLTYEEMLYPVHIAFMKSSGEIYVTDKWKHCVHVFSKEGGYLRSIGQKGSRPGMFRSPEGIATDKNNNHLYVVDTGNDRVQILQPDGKYVDQIGVVNKMQAVNTSTVWENKEVLCTELNNPTGVAITGDRVVVLDSGNRRVKIYNKQDKSKIIEFGAVGPRKGQFRQPEVLAVDPMGFILVGDSGNCRVQVFKPNGHYVRAFGRMGSEPGKFGWISGIHVTKQLDIIISDTKNRSVSFF